MPSKIGDERKIGEPGGRVTACIYPLGDWTSISCRILAKSTASCFAVVDCSCLLMLVLPGPGG